MDGTALTACNTEENYQFGDASYCTSHTYTANLMSIFKAFLGQLEVLQSQPRKGLENIYLSDGRPALSKARRLSAKSHFVSLVLLNWPILYHILYHWSCLTGLMCKS